MLENQEINIFEMICARSVSIRQTLYFVPDRYQITRLATFAPDRYHLKMGRILSLKDIGKLVKAKRKVKKLSQQELADNCGVGRRFISDLEGGKKSRMDLGLTLRVLVRLDLEILVNDKSGKDQ